MKTSTSLSVQYDNIFSPFPGRQWEDGLRWVKDAGFDAVEIILSDPDLIDRRLLQKRLFTGKSHHIRRSSLSETQFYSAKSNHNLIFIQ